MHDEHFGANPEDIDAELAAAQVWEQRRPAPTTTRGVRERGVGERGIGARLIHRCGAAAELRLQTLVTHESSLRPGLDSAIVIGYGSALVESTLIEYVADPLFAEASRLVAAVARDRGPARVLADWGARTKPPTLGTVENLLLALRRGVQDRMADVAALAEATFGPHFRTLLAGPALGKALGQLRKDYRVPAAHGLKTFSREEYLPFAQLAVAHVRFTEWADVGPEQASPPLEAGVFHHLLTALRRRSTVVADPLDALLSLEAPTDSGLWVRAGVAPPDGPGGHRLGQAVRPWIEGPTGAYGLLVDVGTSGEVAVLWPNAAAPLGRFPEGQRLEAPGGLYPTGLTLQGAAGVERLVALAATEPWPAELRPGVSEEFRVLSSAEQTRLAVDVERRTSGSWAVAHAAFRVLG